MKNELLQSGIDEQRESNFSVIDTFISGSIDVARQRLDVISSIDNNDISTLLQMGFPSYVLPIVEMWRRRGPDVLTSFSHPEELDFDKTTALFNLKLYQMRMAHLGFEFPRVLVNQYDTIPLRKSVQKPFGFAEFGSGFDMFSLGGERMSNAGVTTARKDAILSGFEDKKADISNAILAKLNNDFLDAFKNGDIATKERKALVLGVSSLVNQRLGEIADALSTTLLSNPHTTAELLMGFDRELMRRIFGHETSIEEGFGFETGLLSGNERFLNLIKDSINVIVEAKGVGFLREFVGEKEGLCALDDKNGNRSVLTVTDGSFALNTDGVVTPVTDDVAMEAISSGKPLAKLESIALFAGATTFHMGSEYGIRSLFVEKLGFAGRAADYVNGLRIAQDKKHGNFCVVLEGTETSPPTPLMFVLLGSKRIKELVYSQAGRTNNPLVFSMKEFKQFVAKVLLEDANISEKKHAMEEGVSYGLIG